MILITGAAGHIGNVLVRTLYQKGHRKLRLFVLPKEDISHIKEYAQEIITGDICDAKTVLKAAQGCDCIFHLAGLVTVSDKNKKHTFDVNYGGTKNVIEACKKNSVKRLIYLSTTDSLKRLENGCIDETLETDIVNLHGVYAKSKAMANLEVAQSVQEGLDAITVFSSSVLGAYDYQRSLTGNMIREYLKENKTHFYFKGKYNFIDVEDVVGGIILAWETAPPRQSYVLAGHDCSIKDIISAVEASTGRKIKKIRLPAVIVKISAILAPLYYAISKAKPVISKNAIDILLSNVIISCEKAQSDLGFSVRPINKTIDDIVKWNKQRK